MPDEEEGWGQAAETHSCAQLDDLDVPPPSPSRYPLSLLRSRSSQAVPIYSQLLASACPATGGNLEK